MRKGTISAGVQRRYSGTVGRPENGQIGVFDASVTSHGLALVDRGLYLPKSWTDDRERCRAAKIPDERVFATKPELARTIVLRGLGSPLPTACVTADAAYGQGQGFRRTLEEAVHARRPKVPAGVFGRVDHLFTQASNQAWEQCSCGNGAKGPRVYHWAAVQLPVPEAFDDERPTHRRWALARGRSAAPIRSPTTAYTRGSAPASTGSCALPGAGGPSRNASRPRMRLIPWSGHPDNGS
ncbi:transposase [Streptomyces tendae]|uniref:IS701 family transposase n=1 Tax=Streptomyces tendae TaxID=1932 RepID=UPI00367F10FD